MAGKEVANKGGDALALPEDLKLPGQAGLEAADSESFAIPFLVILQKTNPQVDPDADGYVEGAKTGDFFDTVAAEVLEGDISIIPVFYRRAMIEWVPRNAGGGFVAEHAVDSGIYAKTTRTKDGDMLPNGNQIVDTRYHYVIVVTADGQMRPMVVTLTSTQVKKSKRLNSDLNLQMQALGLRATFQLKYKVTSVPESNEHGSWRGWQFDRDGLVDDQDQLNAAVSFYKACAAGEVREAHDSLDPETKDDDIPF